jgi:hypothetical protein
MRSDRWASLVVGPFFNFVALSEPIARTAQSGAKLIGGDRLDRGREIVVF